VGLMHTTGRWGRRLRNLMRGGAKQSPRQPRRLNGFEQLEARRLLAADISVGAVYFEDSTGEDLAGDMFHITFQGGASGTQLTQFTINTDKLGNGLTIGDSFFDTTAGGAGAFGHAPFQLVSLGGVDSYSVSVADGGTLLVLTFEGFDAGDVFSFSIDVDEQGFIGSNAVAEGNEFEGSTFEAQFTAPHHFNAVGAGMFIDAFNANFAGKGLALPNDDYMPPGAIPQPVLTAGAVDTLAQQPLPSSISGTVYEDHNLDNDQDPGDQGLSGVMLSLYKLENGSYVDTGRTAVTDGNGFYDFEDVLPGTYRVVETQPAPYLSVGATAGNVGGVTNGIVSNADVISQITLLGGQDSVNNDFAEALPGGISGRVHADLDGDCTWDPGEPLLAGVTIYLLDAQGNRIDQTTTNAQGEYSFVGLPPGTYGIEEVQPDGYFNGTSHPGTAGGVKDGPNQINSIVLVSGTLGENYDFCEKIPVEISGRVHADIDGDCTWDPGEPLLAGVTIYLLDAQGNRIDQTTTNAQGVYSFEGLPPGTYGVEEVQPDGYFNGTSHPGTVGGTKDGPNKIILVALTSGQTGENYDFCEKIPVEISGRVHADIDGDCTWDPGEPLLAGVTIYLLDAQGNRIDQTTTNAQGVYSFEGLPPGTYGVEEVQPDGYFNGTSHPGTVGGTKDGPNKIVQIVLTSGQSGENYDFCEKIPVEISGRVHADIDGDCTWDPGEPLLAGVTIYLLDAQGNRIDQTTTNAQGVYSFEGLPPGTYGVEEVQPNGYFNGTSHPGSVGGTKDGPNKIVLIELTSGQSGLNYDFCEKIPVEIHGRVHADYTGDCEFEPGDVALEGVTIHLLDAQGNRIASTLTNENGEYSFVNLKPGTYGIEEVQPDGYYNRASHPGSVGGLSQGPDKITLIELTSGQVGLHYNFCETPPVGISGYVYVDANNNGQRDEGETGIGGVTVTLLDANGNPTGQTVQTNANGFYQFTGLRPGTYGVAEAQPARYLDGEDAAGNAGGTAQNPGDKISGAILDNGILARHYNFGEIPPATISGYVFIDGRPIQLDDGQTINDIDLRGVRNGVFDAGDTPLAGVTLRLGDTDGQPVLDEQGNPITTVTDKNGFYEFTGLRPGTYSIIQVQPTGLISGVNTPGTTGGIAALPSEAGTLSPAALSILSEYGYNAIIQVTVSTGGESRLNNFSEVQTVRLPPPPPPLPPITPPPFPPQIPMVPQGNFPAYMAAPPTTAFSQPSAFFGGAGVSTAGFSWHLSVVNAGNPRGDAGQEGAFIRVSEAKLDAFSRDARLMAHSKWQLKAGDATDLRGVAFGRRGSVPITGDFNGDGITDVGVFYHGQWFIDLNGNGIWDDDDLWASLGKKGDMPVTGDWDGDGKTDIGIFGTAWAGDPRAAAAEPGLPDPHNAPKGARKNIPPAPDQATNGRRELKCTAHGRLRSDVIDHVFYFGGVGDVAVAGDWNGDGIDTIGVFNMGVWVLDTNGDGQWQPGELMVDFGQPGDIPVVGDWNGDGVDELGVYRNGVFHLDTNRDYTLDARDKVFELGAAGDTPVVGDWNGDGIDDVGVFRDGETNWQSL
jgi:serine-aspartate repeat-containing protein C/D/E